MSRAGDVLWGVAVLCSIGAGAERPAVTAQAPAAHLRADDRVGDLLEHPAFAGFAGLLLPWDDRRYDPSMRLREVGSLLPYHSHVDPDVVVSSINRMIDDVAAGRTLFYDFYSAAEKAADPSRRNTGLFFLRGKPGAPFAVIAPGGGFAYVASVHEGFPFAAEINKEGFNAFVLRYRAGQGGRIATEDLAAALTYIFRHASDLGVTTTGYSLWGSSAGARMAASIGSDGAARCGGARLPLPSTVVMLHRPFGRRCGGTADLRRRRGDRRHRAARGDGTARGSVATRGDRRGIPPLSRCRSRVRAWRRAERRRMDRRCRPLLGKTHRPWSQVSAAVYDLTPQIDASARCARLARPSRPIPPDAGATAPA